MSPIGRRIDPPPAYCRYFCEENVWHLCEHPLVAEHPRWVVFVSNRQRRVAMWAQRAAAGPGLPIAWDYHVVLLVRGLPDIGEWAIWDLDSTLPMPLSAEAWLQASFAGIGQLPAYFAPWFRVVRSADYRRYFRSDRSHMRSSDGRFKHEPPSWPAILGERYAQDPNQGSKQDPRASNLERFIAMDDATFLGERMDLPGLHAWLRRSAG